MTRDRKYVIPFPNGITVPTEDYTDTAHDRQITFPASYQPTIMSALKVLARPETYQSDTPSELNYAVQQGHDILANVGVAINCDFEQSNSVLTVDDAGVTYTDAFFVGTPYNHVSRYAFASVSYLDNDPQLNQPRFWITSPGYVNAGCTWDITIQTRVPGRVFLITTQKCGETAQNESGVMDGQFLTRHYTDMFSVYMYIDVCDWILGLIDISDVTCGDI